MMNTSSSLDRMKATFCAIGLSATIFAAAGCQITVGGQTLPSPYYTSDDVQFFPAGTEFKLSREAAAMKEFSARQQLGGP